MIGQLLRTEIESSRVDFRFGFLFVFLPLFLILTVLAAAPASDDTDSVKTLASIGAATALFASLITGVRMLIRRIREKRVRLYSQLPVSSQQSSIASWCFRLLCLAIPTAVWLSFLLLGVDRSVAGATAGAGAFFLAAVVVVADVSVAMSLFARPRWLGLAVVVTIAAVIAVSWSRPEILDQISSAVLGQESQPATFTLLLLAATGLVFLDVWLRNRSDNYLG